MGVPIESLVLTMENEETPLVGRAAAVGESESQGRAASVDGVACRSLGERAVVGLGDRWIEIEPLVVDLQGARRVKGERRVSEMGSRKWCGSSSSLAEGRDELGMAMSTVEPVTGVVGRRDELDGYADALRASSSGGADSGGFGRAGVELGDVRGMLTSSESRAVLGARSSEGRIGAGRRLDAEGGEGGSTLVGRAGASMGDGSVGRAAAMVGEIGELSPGGRSSIRLVVAGHDEPEAGGSSSVRRVAAASGFDALGIRMSRHRSSSAMVRNDGPKLGEALIGARPIEVERCSSLVKGSSSNHGVRSWEKRLCAGELDREGRPVVDDGVGEPRLGEEAWRSSSGVRGRASDDRVAPGDVIAAVGRRVEAESAGDLELVVAGGTSSGGRAISVGRSSEEDGARISAIDEVDFGSGVDDRRRLGSSGFVDVNRVTVLGEDELGAEEGGKRGSVVARRASSSRETVLGEFVTTEILDVRGVDGPRGPSMVVGRLAMGEGRRSEMGRRATVSGSSSIWREEVVAGER